MLKSLLTLSLFVTALIFCASTLQAFAQPDPQSAWLENKVYNTHILMPEEQGAVQDDFVLMVGHVRLY